MIRSTSPSTAKKTSAGTYCSLRAARNTTLSRRPITTSRPISMSSSAGLTRLTPVRVTVGATSAATERRDDRQVEGDVGDGAPVAAGEGHLVRPRWEADGVGASPVAEAAGHRLEVAGERPPRARPARASRAAPSTGSASRRRSAPATRRRRPRTARGPEVAVATKRPPSDVEHEELHDVDDVHHLGRAEAVLGPLGGEDADPLEERPLVERRRDRQAAGFRS